MGGRCPAAWRRSRSAATKTTRWATPRSKRCKRSGTARPTRRSAKRCCRTSRPPPVQTAACAGACETMDAALGSDHGGVREAAASRVVVVIPTLDEEQSIADVVRGIPRAIVPGGVGPAGGSRTATAARAKAAGADVIEAGRGYGRACLAATMAAEDADIVVFMDGDGADDPRSIAALVEPIRSGR